MWRESGTARRSALAHRAVNLERQRQPLLVCLRVRLGDGSTEHFDHAILACHADQSLALLDPLAKPAPRQ